MWDFNWMEGTSAEMASHTCEIHVLLVDHDGPQNTANLLHLCQYKVTFVELASAAISILSSGKVKYDAVVANINSPDLNGFKLLQVAVNMGLQIIVMSYDDDILVAMRALESGALLYIKKPATMEVLRSLWQHVLREKSRFIKQWERFREITSERENLEGNRVIVATNDAESRKKFKARRECTDWSPQLHAKFMNAVRELGEGRCFPKEILDLMNVDGLTRLQVASHLQKCRNDDCRVQERRTRRKSQHEDGPRINPRKFGTMPQFEVDNYHIPLQDGQNAGTENIINNSNYVYGNMEIAPASNDNYDQYYVVPPHYGYLLPPDDTSIPSEDFYNLLDMNGFNQNFSGLQQLVSNMNNPDPGTYHFDPDYPDQLNSAMPSMDGGNNWSSQSSNFGK